MKTEEETIRSMVKSPDRESRYMAVQILRKGAVHFTSRFRKSMLNKVPLEDRFKDYTDICEELCEKELTLEDFCTFPEMSRKKLLTCAKLDQIQRLLNGDWIADLTDPNQDKWYPYFDIKQGLGLVFRASNGRLVCSFGSVALFRNEKISDFVGNTFLYLYQDLV